MRPRQTLLLLVAVVMAAVVPLRAEEDELSVARQALRDGLWEVARTHALRRATPEAKLVVLESLAGEGKWDEIGRCLKEWPDESGYGFDYYRAVVDGRHDEAKAILGKAGSAEGCVEARLHEAEKLAQKGDRPGAVALWRDVVSLTNVSERALVIASVNLMEAEPLRRAFANVRSLALRRTVGLRLGMVLMRDPKTAEEGERLVRTIARDSPDADGAKEAFLAVADAKVSAGNWKAAMETYREAVETWPDAAKLASVQEGRGWALQKLGIRGEALEAFRLAGALATDDATRAVAAVKEADVLSDMGNADEAMSRYREVLEKFPKTPVAEKLKAVIRLREKESDGRRLYGEGRYGEAMGVFGEIAEEDSSRRQRMAYFKMLCLYGQGQEEAALHQARNLVDHCPDSAVRADALLWLAKFLYNRRDWRESGRFFAAYADLPVPAESAAEALLWAARAALAENDFDLAIQLSTRLSDRYSDSRFKPSALIAQGEALVELARFDEAVLVFERAALSEGLSPEDRLRTQILKADALYAMGADNAAGYSVALDAYRSILFGKTLSPEDRIVVSFKIARALEKLHRMDEAIDQYYTQVVLAYRTGRLRGELFTDEVRAVFSRAAFRLAEEYESRGRDRQALNVLELVAESDVPASDEARRRIGKISVRGGFL